MTFCLVFYSDYHEGPLQNFPVTLVTIPQRVILLMPESSVYQFFGDQSPLSFRVSSMDFVFKCNPYFFPSLTFPSVSY